MRDNENDCFIKVKKKHLMIYSKVLQNRCHTSLHTLVFNEKEANIEKVCRQKDFNHQHKFQGKRR